MISLIPWLGVIVGTIVGFAFGAFWYFVLSKPWMEACGYTEEDLKDGAGVPMMIITFVCQLVMAIILAGVMFHLGGFSVRTGLISAVLIWVGFVMTTMTVNNQFQSKPAKLTLIDGGHWLGVLIIQSIALGLLGN